MAPGGAIESQVVDLLRQAPDGVKLSEILIRVAAQNPSLPHGTIRIRVEKTLNSQADRAEPMTYRLRSGQASPAPSIRPAAAPELEALGFAPIGSLRLDASRVRVCLIQWEDRRPSLYAFAIDEKVLYIGRTQLPISDRLKMYAMPGPAQRSELRIQTLLRERLTRVDSLDVWALTEWEPATHRGLPIDVLAGLEPALLNRIRPPWNIALA